MPSFKSVCMAFTERAVNVVMMAADCSAVPMPSVALPTSAMMSFRSRKFPAASETCTAVSPIMICPFSIFWVRSRITAAICVPASMPLMP